MPHSLTAASSSRISRSIPLLPTQTFIGFALAVVAVVLMALFSFRSLEARSSAAELVTRTLKVLEGLESFLSAVKDAETGQRGYLLTREEGYLAPYTAAKAELGSELKNLRLQMTDSAQLQRLDELDRLAGEKMAELARTIELRRSGDTEAAITLLRSDRGKAAMDQLRTLIGEMKTAGEEVLARRQAEWQDVSQMSLYITTGGSFILLLLIAIAGVMASRDFRARETQVWLRTGQMGFTSRLQGDRRLDKLGESALQYLADYLDAQVGAIYLSEDSGQFRRFAGYAISAMEVVQSGDGLLGQAAKENRTLHVQNVPDSYLPVTSSLGRGQASELLVAPASVDGVVYAVVELGFFRRINAADQELLARLSEALAVAVRASKDRTRLEELLEETQRQGEELQTQQEELRVSNEELEVQARSLKESQGQLESQQAELEQINSHLEEQTQTLEHQKDELAKSQGVLTEKATELERANQYKSEFLANMSHELRTPLNSSLILAKLLADNKHGNLTPEQVRFAQTIQSAGNDLLAIINDVLDLSKIEARKVEISPEQVEVAKAVDALTKTFQPLAQQKKLAFSVVIEPSARPVIETDAQRLGQILKNLLANALKFTERGSFDLKVYSEGDGTMSFAVSDTGIGIPKHQQEIIFEAFRQADGSTHRRYGGTGLGLSISRDLARMLGGELKVASAPDQGSVFTLTLPLKYTEPVSEAAQAKTYRNTVNDAPDVTRATDGNFVPAAATLSAAEVEDDRDHLSSSARLILVVEDDVRFAAILRDLAHEMGFECVITHSASDAIVAVQKYRPSAVILDINLPDHSGLGVLDQLKRNSLTRHIPVHVASVADFAREALELGAVGYALKPVKREQLVTAFQKLEAKFSQGMRRVLVVEDDARQLESIQQLLTNEEVEIVGVKTAVEALQQLKARTFDCVVMDLNLPDLSGYDLLKKMAEEEQVSFPPVIIYTGRSLSRDEEQQLRHFSKSIIIKDARSPERLLDEVTLFLHQVESKLPVERQRMLKVARDRETTFEGRRILVVEDDVRNIFALTSLLEPKGARIEIARNGKEAIDALTLSTEHPASRIDLVLMDIMMPEMDGITATREIRKRAEWKRLPIIALTAKAMRDDQEKCLAAGANDYIAKPLDVEKLLSLVRVWLPK